MKSTNNKSIFHRKGFYKIKKDKSSFSSLIRKNSKYLYKFCFPNMRDSSKIIV